MRNANRERGQNKLLALTYGKTAVKVIKGSRYEMVLENRTFYIVLDIAAIIALLYSGGNHPPTGIKGNLRWNSGLAGQCSLVVYILVVLFTSLREVLDL